VLIAIQLIFLFKKKKYVSLLEIKKSKAIFFFAMVKKKVKKTVFSIEQTNETVPFTKMKTKLSFGFKFVTCISRKVD